MLNSIIANYCAIFVVFLLILNSFFNESILAFIASTYSLSTSSLIKNPLNAELLLPVSAALPLILVELLFSLNT